ncbi:MAG: glycine C-acetyltransferase [Parachlamydiales bacterium]
MDKRFTEHLARELEEIREAGLFKAERIIDSPQSSHIELHDGTKALNFCANNYLGLADHPDVIAAARGSYEKYGYGMASVRFICGTQVTHKELERRITHFLGTEDTITYAACFDANGGLFETLLGPEDAVISDALNHASIIDGVRLCKAQRFRFAHSDMGDLETKLKEAEGARFRIIATDGVFSMDGDVAKLREICDLADKYRALVMVDDCHATGFMGKGGRGTHEFCEVVGRVDILTGTLGKALGGASGGYTSGRKEIIAMLRQRSRPYLFSNALAPAIACASIEVFDLLEREPKRRERVHENARYFRKGLEGLGFNLVKGDTPIIPVMLGEAKLAEQFAAKMLDHGIYVIGFSFPVVPKGQARIRTQMSAIHTKQDLDKALGAFEAVGKQLGVI